MSSRTADTAITILNHASAAASSPDGAGLGGQPAPISARLLALESRALDALEKLLTTAERESTILRAASAILQHIHRLSRRGTASPTPLDVPAPPGGPALRAGLQPPPPLSLRLDASMPEFSASMPSSPSTPLPTPLILHTNTPARALMAAAGAPVSLSRAPPREAGVGVLPAFPCPASITGIFPLTRKNTQP